MPSTTSFHHQLPSATPQNSTYWKIIYRVLFCLCYFLSSFLILFDAPLHVFWKLFWHVRHIVEYLFQLMSRYAGIIINYSRRSGLVPPIISLHLITNWTLKSLLFFVQFLTCFHFVSPFWRSPCPLTPSVVPPWMLPGVPSRTNGTNNVNKSKRLQVPGV